ncbi:hypothetical protein Lal_00012647, partial [Lupinus albus]
MEEIATIEKKHVEIDDCGSPRNYVHGDGATSVHTRSYAPTLSVWDISLVFGNYKNGLTMDISLVSM